MWFSVGNKYYEVAAYGLLTLVLAAAIYFWGRGIRRSCKSDLLAGPAILVVLCLAVGCAIGAFTPVAVLVFIFGSATMWLSAMAKPNGILKTRDIQAIGAGFLFAGFALCMIA